MSQKTNFHTYDPPPTFVVFKIVRVALEEDLGRGDITTRACVEPTQPGKAYLVCREKAIWCGSSVFVEVHHQVDSCIEVQLHKQDGDEIQPGEKIATVYGAAASILMAERVALNFVQRMSAIATLAHRYVCALPANSQTKIVDTRKTTPGLRALERFAVRCGGAFNHREDLSSAILIKDNHIQIAGGVAKAISKAKHQGPHCSKIECEVDNLAQLQEALAAGADIVLLDNFDKSQVQQAIAMVDGKAEIEVSGGITLETVSEYAMQGVAQISVGALTHSVCSVDFGLDWA